ncbi:MAG: ABC transporter permease [Candidatus Heimdallarchaeota archaeon]|jgi:ABC-type lipoprotein release transport system permease subunit|nr:ABC transporter permease [Candidatus Heimdallarchaeota archaeon]
MLIFIKLGFRNVFRNKRRSLLTACAIGVSICALIITDGFMEGMIQNMVKTATSGLLGHGQIHHSSYIKNPEVEFVIKNPKNIESKILNESVIQSWSRRVYSLGMISSPRNAINTSLVGIDLRAEKKTTDIINYLTKGSFLPSENSVVIGRELEKKLGVQVGSKVVLTTTEAKTGELRQDVFRVSGVISFGSKKTDSSIVFVQIGKLQTLLSLGNNYHELVLNLGDPFQIDDQNNPFWKRLSFDNNKARSWATISPGLGAVVDMSALSISIISVIMGILMGLIIVNALFMAIFERLFEFGVVRALGTKNKHLMLTMLTESTTLGALSALFGIVLALIFGGLLAYYGIDYGGIEFNNVTFREPIYFIFKTHQWIVYPLAGVLFTTIVGIYPAIFTIRLNINRALKKTL